LTATRADAVAESRSAHAGLGLRPHAATRRCELIAVAILVLRPSWPAAAWPAAFSPEPRSAASELPRACLGAFPFLSGAKAVAAVAAVAALTGCTIGGFGLETFGAFSSEALPFFHHDTFLAFAWFAVAVAGAGAVGAVAVLAVSLFGAGAVRPFAVLALDACVGVARAILTARGVVFGREGIERGHTEGQRHDE